MERVMLLIYRKENNNRKFISYLTTTFKTCRCYNFGLHTWKTHSTKMWTYLCFNLIFIIFVLFCSHHWIQCPFWCRSKISFWYYRIDFFIWYCCLLDKLIKGNNHIFEPYRVHSCLFISSTIIIWTIAEKSQYKNVMLLLLYPSNYLRNFFLHSLSNWDTSIQVMKTFISIVVEVWDFIGF